MLGLNAGLFMVIATDDNQLYCLHCGYDLRKLPTNRCPECGNRFDPDRPLTFFPSPHSLNVRALWVSLPLSIAFVALVLIVHAKFGLGVARLWISSTPYWPLLLPTLLFDPGVPIALGAYALAGLGHRRLRPDRVAYTVATLGVCMTILAGFTVVLTQ